MNIQLPKKSPASLIKQVNNAIKKAEAGHPQVKRTKLRGLLTLRVNHKIRVVLCGDNAHVFSDHDKYERFINQYAA